MTNVEEIMYLLGGKTDLSGQLISFRADLEEMKAILHKIRANMVL